MSVKLKIKFIPEKGKFEEAAREYQQIWQEDGEKIINAIENVTRLPFKETEIDVVVFEGRPFSNPILHLKASDNKFRKTATFVHELIHRHFIASPVDPTKFEAHQRVDLVLYDIWVEAFGIEFAKNAVFLECDPKFGTEYKKCWDWALAMNFEERQKMFRSILRVTVR